MPGLVGRIMASPVESSMALSMRCSGPLSELSFLPYSVMAMASRSSLLRSLKGSTGSLDAFHRSRSSAVVSRTQSKTPTRASGCSLGAIMRCAMPQFSSSSYAVKRESWTAARIRFSSRISSARATLLTKTIVLPKTLTWKISPYCSASFFSEAHRLVGLTSKTLPRMGRPEGCGIGWDMLTRLRAQDGTGEGVQTFEPGSGVALGSYGTGQLRGCMATRRDTCSHRRSAMKPNHFVDDTDGANSMAQAAGQSFPWHRLGSESNFA